jgi:hypothetical protein
VQAQSEFAILGRVTSSAGGGVEGATVRLAKGGLETITNENGDFALGSNISGVAQGLAPGSTSYSKPFFSAGKLRFSLSGQEMPVSIRLYDLNGRLLQQLLNSRLRAGDYAFAIDQHRLATQFFLLQIDIGGNTQVIKVPTTLSAGTGSRAVLGKSESKPTAALARSAAVIDTIIVWKNGYYKGRVAIESTQGTQDVVLEKSSSWNGDTAAFWGDVNSIPVASQVMTYKFLNRTNGRWSDSQIFWSWNGITKSLAEQSTLDMPANSAGRVNFYLETANSQYYDFIEHTIANDVWNGNTTRVDWFGFPIALRLVCDDGYDEAVGEDYTLFYQDRDGLFNEFKNEVPAEFDHLAEIQAPFRIVCPGTGEFKNGGMYQNYFTDYVNEVWAANGFSIAKPNTEQVFRCNGPLATEPEKSAILNRHVGTRDKADWRNSKYFYLQGPANYYAQFLHDRSMHNRAYGFAYDDFAEQAAYLSHQQPKYLLVAIGW